MTSGAVDFALGDVLQRVERPEAVDPLREYRHLGVRWYGDGLFAKEYPRGASIRATTLYRVETDDIVYNRLFAWKGSFAVADASHAGCYVSNEFPCFRICDPRLDLGFLSWWFRQPSLWDRALGRSRGATATSRNRLNPEEFLRFRIAIPSLRYQRTIAATLSNLEALNARLRRLAERRAETVDRLLAATYRQLVSGAPSARLEDVAPLVRRPVPVQLDAEYPELGIRSFGKGTFHKPALPGPSVGTKKLYRIRTGDLLFSVVFAWEGAVAIAQSADDGRVGSHRFLTCVPHESVADVRFLWYHFLTPEGIMTLQQASPGGAGRNRTLSLENLKRLPVPVPALESQRLIAELVDVRARLTSTWQAQAATSQALLESSTLRAFGELAVSSS